MTNTITENQINVSRFAQAPMNIPKYSIHQALKEKDEFRKAALVQQKEKLKDKNKKEFLYNVLAVLAATAGFIMLHVKKII